MKNALTDPRRIESANLLGGVQDAPDFLDTTGASLSHKYMPLVNKIREDAMFPLQVEDGYVASKNIPEDLTEYGTSLIRATSQSHMDFLANNLRSGLETRETLARSGLIAQFGSEIFDPVNFIAIPFSGGAKLSGMALRAGAGTAAIVTAQEAIRAPLDPLNTTTETAINIGSAFILGTALGGLVSVPAASRIKAQKDGEIEINNLRIAIETQDGVPFDASIATSMFTDSWIYKGVTTPMKRILTDESIPNSVKLNTLKIANDAGILLAGHKKGQTLEPSVFQGAKLYEGEWVQTYDKLLKVWGDSTGEGVTAPMDYMWKRADFDTWLADVDRKAIQKIAPTNDFEAQAMEGLNKFYAQWETRLNDEGLIGNRAYYERFAVDRERRIEGVQKRLEGVKSADYRANLEGQLRRLGDELDGARSEIQILKDMGPITPKSGEPYRPRYWDRSAISERRDEFRAILESWYRDNPTINSLNKKTGKFERVTLSSDAQAITARADETIAGILNEVDTLDPDAGYLGAGMSKHMKRRVLDIPNALVVDFMERNPVNIMKAYVHRTGPRYEFSRKFNGQSIDDVLDDTFNEIMESGGTREQAYAAMKDIRHLHERVAGAVLRNPDTLDQKSARVLRDLAQLNYLGSAGMSTITEPAKIIMEHGLGPSIRGLFSIMKSNQLRLGGKEARLAGEALEILSGSSHLRLVDDMNNPMSTGVIDKAKDAFYLLNGLAPITRLLKDFDGMMRSHTLIDYSVRLTQGKATKMEQEYLSRYGIDAQKAQAIANAPWQKSESGMYMANTEAWTNTIEFPSTKAEIVSGPTNSYAASGRYKPAFYRESEGKIYIDEEYIKDVMWNERGWENPRVEGVKPIESGIINSPDDLVTFIKMHEIMHTIHSSKSLGFDKRTSAGKADYENAINDLATTEIKAQARVAPETVETFRSSLSSGIMNTILMGTPADKPIITDGVVYIPMRVAKQFGMKEDPKYKGYSRIENGMLGLPFQFYSYSLAAVNKTMGAMAQGQIKNQYIGTAVAMGLGYMLLQYKTPDFVEMEFQDQFARAFDYSGIAPLYSDMFYTAMSTSLALGGPNITGGVLQPRFPQKPDTVGAVTGVLGAGPNIGTDIARGAYDLVTGNIGEGTKELIRNMPFARLWFLKGLVNNMTNAIAEEIDGPSGFKRY